MQADKDGCRQIYMDVGIGIGIDTGIGIGDTYKDISQWAQINLSMLLS